MPWPLAAKGAIGLVLDLLLVAYLAMAGRAAPWAIGAATTLAPASPPESGRGQAPRGERRVEAALPVTGGPPRT